MANTTILSIIALHAVRWALSAALGLVQVEITEGTCWLLKTPTCGQQERILGVAQLAVSRVCTRGTALNKIRTLVTLGRIFGGGEIVIGTLF